MDDLKKQIQKELLDEKYFRFTHGRRSTNDEGCKGPLCKKAGRDRARNRDRKKSLELERQQRIKYYIPSEEDIFIDKIQQIYELELTIRKLESRRTK